MTFSFHPGAEAEFNKAIDYYEEIEPGLGLDFAIEVHSAIQRSIAFPKAWPIIDSEIRRSLVSRFPSCRNPPLQAAHIGRGRSQLTPTPETIKHQTPYIENYAT